MPVTEVRSKQELDGLLRAKKMVVIDFFATWCGPCQMIKPEFDKISDEYRVDTAFVKVDVDKLKDVAQTHNVRAMPTFVIFKGGSEVGRIQGADIAKLR